MKAAQSACRAAGDELDARRSVPWCLSPFSSENAAKGRDMTKQTHESIKLSSLNDWLWKWFGR